jgi:hypothetical protein
MKTVHELYYVHLGTRYTQQKHSSVVLYKKFFRY